MSYVASFFPWFPHENLAPFQAFTPDDPHLNALFSNLFPNVFPWLIHLFHPFPRCFPNFSPTLFREDMFFPIFSQFFRCFPSFHPISTFSHQKSRLFFEELRDSGDRNAAAAQALRRLVESEASEAAAEERQRLGGGFCGDVEL